MHLLIAQKAINILQGTKGIEKAFLLDKSDVKNIMTFEEKDERMNSLYFGKKRNLGVKQALMADILIAFVTNRDYNWPKDNLKIMYQGEIIGKDISSSADIEKYMNSNDHCVFGNIVINFRKMMDLKNTNEPPLMIINAKPCKEIESMGFISKALIASPSRLTDNYIKSKIPCKNNLHIGSFLVGLKLKAEWLKQPTISHIVEN